VKRLIGVPLLFVAVLTAALLTALPSPFFLLTPGGSYEIGTRLRIPEERRREMGRLAFTAVYAQPSNWGEAISARLSRTAEIVPAEEVRPQGVYQEQVNEVNRRLMDESKPVAAAVALRAAGYDVKIRGEGAEVVRVIERMPAEGVLQVGDLIAAVDGQPIQTAVELTEAVRRHKVGDQVRLRLTRDGQQQEIVVSTANSPTEPGRPLIGVQVSTRGFAVDLPFPVEIDTDNVGGPSAGLMLALGILDAVTGGDLTRGYYVAGTGTVSVDGAVGPVGGVGEKVTAAERDGAQVFLVPRENFGDARKRARSAQVLAVDQFADAVRALCGLNPQSAASATLPGPCQ
jgi:PDZ domain-containing protein